MKQIVDTKKYNTDTADLLAVIPNRFLLNYEKRLEQWHLENDPVEDEDDEPSEELPEEDLNLAVRLMSDTELDEEEKEEEDGPDPETPKDDPDSPSQPTVSDYVWPDEVVEVPLSPLWKITRLYRKKATGEYFLVIAGGYLSGFKYPRVVVFENQPNEFKTNEELAKEWAIANLSVCDVERIFGGIEE